MEKEKYEKLIKKYKDLYDKNIEEINKLAQKERYCHVQSLESRTSVGFAFFLIPFIIQIFLFIAIMGQNLDLVIFRTSLLGSAFVCFFIAEPLFFYRRKKKYPEFNDFIKDKTKKQLFEEKVRLTASFRYLKSYNKVYIKLIEYYKSKIKLIDEIESDYTITKKDISTKTDTNILDKQLVKYEKELKEIVKRNIVIESFHKLFNVDLFQEIMLGMMAGVAGMMYWNLPYLARNTEGDTLYTPPSLFSMFTPMIICIFIPIIYNIIIRKYLKKIFIIFNDELEEKIPKKTSYYELTSDGENKRDEIKNQIYTTLIELDKLN